MTVNVGVMQLPVTEDPDPVRTYLNGTHPSGGLWTALTRASNHDHSGGLNGVVLGATSIPDGSITTAKLDPSVLLPYALVDGSKPFTGTVTMNADQLIRDTLRFGAKPAGVADATLARTGAGALRVDTHLGVGVNPAGWGGPFRALQLGQTGALWANSGADSLYISTNTYYDGTTRRALTANLSTEVVMSSGVFQVFTAPSVAAGAVITPTQRLGIAPTGTLTLTPDAGQAALVANGYADFHPSSGMSGLRVWKAGVNKLDLSYGGTLTLTPDAGQTALASGGPLVMSSTWQLSVGGSSLDLWKVGKGNPYLQVSHPNGTLTLTPEAGQPTITSPTTLILGSVQHVEVRPGAGMFFMPGTDNTFGCGHPSVRWSAVYAVNGAIQTSSQDFKEGITPLDPAECYQAAKDVRWYEYAYRPPVYTPPEPPPDIAYDAADDNETKAEKKAARDEAEAQAREAHLKMVAETAPARHQRGFVFPAGAESKDEAGGALPPVPDLFGLSDRESTTPQADLATLGAALQEVIRRLELLEAPN
jgi:hypothetical protein